MTASEKKRIEGLAAEVKRLRDELNQTLAECREHGLKTSVRSGYGRVNVRLMQDTRGGAYAKVILDYATEEVTR
jgi:hypothetical protein